jgi:hypothetical protein
MILAFAVPRPLLDLCFVGFFAYGVVIFCVMWSRK